jgi:hypothetical protein
MSIIDDSCNLLIASISIIIVTIMLQIDHTIKIIDVTKDLVSYKLEDLLPTLKTGDLIFLPCGSFNPITQPYQYYENTIFISVSKCQYNHVGLIIVLNNVPYICDVSSRIRKDELDKTYKRHVPILTLAEDRFVKCGKRVSIYRHNRNLEKTDNEIVDIINTLKSYNIPKTNWVRLKKYTNTVKDFRINGEKTYTCSDVIIQCLHKLGIVNSRNLKKIDYENHTVGILDLLTYAKESGDYHSPVTFSKNHWINKVT